MINKFKKGLALSTVEGPAADPGRFVTSQISVVMVNSPWVWPASETVHFLGLSLTFGVLLAVNLRILGVMRQVPFADVHRLLPWGMLGFGANLITGMLFFIGQPKQYIDSAPFYWKVVFLMIAGGLFSMFYFASLYLQNILGYSPLTTGLAFLPVTFGIGIGATVAEKLIPRVGLRPVLITGMLVAAAGLAILAMWRLHARVRAKA